MIRYFVYIIILFVAAKSYAGSSKDTLRISQLNTTNEKNDNSLTLQSAIATGKTIIIDEDLVITKNIYLFGTASLIGINTDTMKLKKITISGDFASKDGRKYFINCGIKSKLGDNTVWSGKIENLKFVAAPDAAFNYCIQLHNVKGITINNNVFDFTKLQQSTVKGDTRGCAIEGLNDRNWNKGSVYRFDVTISNNRVINKQDYPGQEGIGISSAQKVSILNNYCFGMGDDGIGVHNVKDFIVTGNQLYLIAGRILISNSQNGLVSKNYIERIPMQNIQSGIFANSESFIKLESESKHVKAANNSNIIIDSNIIYIPSNYKPIKPLKTYIIRIKGAENCKVVNNKIYIDCDIDYVTVPITIENEISKNNQTLIIPESVLIADNKVIVKNSRNEQKLMQINSARVLGAANNNLKNIVLRKNEIIKDSSRSTINSH
jgi:hypothetical protein